MTSQTISLFSNECTDHFVIERQGVANIAPIETFTDRQNASFEWTGPHLTLDPGGHLPADSAKAGNFVGPATRWASR